MGAILKTKNYLLGISFFCLAYGGSLVVPQLCSFSSTVAATPAARLDDWRFTPERLQLEISLSGDTRPQHFSLREPNRIVIDLPNTKLGYVPTKQDFSGAIKSIRLSQLNTDVTRVVLDVAPGTVLDANQVQLQLFTWQRQNIWVLRPGNNVAYNNTQQNNYGNFYTQTINNNIPNLNDPPVPLFPQLSNNNNIPNKTYSNNNQPPNTFNPLPNKNLPIPINPQIQPRVVVPPLNGNNQSQPVFSFNPALPPAKFENQPGFVKTIPPANRPSFPQPNVPQYQQRNNRQFIPYGQPLTQF